LLVLAAVTAFLAVIQARQWLSNNFGVVDAGRVYRSAQPAGEVERLVRSQGLASILNLRGGSPADSFYAEELQVTRALGVDFYDFPMSPKRRPSRRELLVLLDLFEGCRYPLLIHCRRGADRTGLASALYLMSCRGEGPDEALRAFALTYGHVPLLGTEHLHEPLDEYAAWLRTRGLAHTPERFRSWVEHDYRSDDPSSLGRRLTPGPREPRLSEAPSPGGETSRE
jgi:hypothetical protein